MLKYTFNTRDQHLRQIEKKFRVTLHPRGNKIRIIGPRSQTQQAISYLQNAYAQTLTGKPPAHPQSNNDQELPDYLAKTTAEDNNNTILVTYNNIKLGPKTEGQRHYLQTIANKDVVFAIGPAGTGKTYLAVLSAVQKFLSKKVDRIILARPAVEAGEKLGYLPGDLTEKVNPYLRPLYDALNDMLPFDRVEQLISSGKIEVAPLAFMRGRTLNQAFIILDEAQNTTPEQMKMFLTRIGEGSQVVITGDVTQTDLPNQRYSGLSHALKILKKIPQLGFVTLDQTDIVRHSIVQAILDAYEAETT
ncbi:phoH-like protein [Ylistrum balloti]|uniref:phoH-like protein n=1 Tax=Ylistrum balloti TaxID=509963 RepID=UPI002905F278|nr:phoH-like protein [Ylistrum balloti]